MTAAGIPDLVAGSRPPAAVWGGAAAPGERVREAIRIVMVQADCSHAVAVERLQRRADLSQRSFDDLARAVIEHRVWFDPQS